MGQGHETYSCFRWISGTSILAAKHGVGYECLRATCAQSKLHPTLFATVIILDGFSALW
jgi:hypothetical protein